MFVKKNKKPTNVINDYDCTLSSFCRVYHYAYEQLVYCTNQVITKVGVYNLFDAGGTKDYSRDRLTQARENLYEAIRSYTDAMNTYNDYLIKNEDNFNKAKGYNRINLTAYDVIADTYRNYYKVRR